MTNVIYISIIAGLTAAFLSSIIGNIIDIIKEYKK